MQATWSTPTGTLGVLLVEAQRRAELLRIREPELVAAAERVGGMASLERSLRGATVGVIAELKRRSPSKGAINMALNATARATAYAEGGASAISVLTEPSHFGGSTADLTDVIRTVSIPVLKKDFHVQPIQMLEAKALAASAALLIARALSPSQLTSMADLARQIGLEVIIEVRDEWELDRALAAGARMIGINNRDLETLAIDRSTSERLLPRIPPECVAIAESGMRTTADVEAVAREGADAVLVGSLLSAAADARAAVASLASIPRIPRGG